MTRTKQNLLCEIKSINVYFEVSGANSNSLQISQFILPKHIYGPCAHACVVVSRLGAYGTAFDEILFLPPAAGYLPRMRSNAVLCAAHELKSFNIIPRGVLLISSHTEHYLGFTL